MHNFFFVVHYIVKKTWFFGVFLKKLFRSIFVEIFYGLRFLYEEIALKITKMKKFWKKSRILTWYAFFLFLNRRAPTEILTLSDHISRNKRPRVLKPIWKDCLFKTEYFKKKLKALWHLLLSWHAIPKRSIFKKMVKNFKKK